MDPMDKTTPRWSFLEKIEAPKQGKTPWFVVGKRFHPNANKNSRHNTHNDDNWLTLIDSWWWSPKRSILMAGGLKWPLQFIQRFFSRLRIYMCVDDTPSFLTKKHYFILMVSWNPLKPADILFEKSAKKIHRNGEKKHKQTPYPWCINLQAAACRLQLDNGGSRAPNWWALEKVTPCKHWQFLVSMLDFWGVII